MQIGYFSWSLVTAYIVLVGVFVYGVLKPRRKREWKSAGLAQAWVIALYAEMYGLPLTAYLVMGWLGRPVADAEVHFNGHLWPVLVLTDQTSIEYAQIAMTVIGQLLILSGAVLALIGWRQIHRGVRRGEMVSTGLYSRIRHPQYTGFFLFLLGSAINWPTIATLVTLPILWVVYLRLARAEEQDAIEAFGEPYQKYMSRTGRFLPYLGSITVDKPMVGRSGAVARS